MISKHGVWLFALVLDARSKKTDCSVPLVHDTSTIIADGPPAHGKARQQTVRRARRLGGGLGVEDEIFEMVHRLVALVPRRWRRTIAALGEVLHLFMRAHNCTHACSHMLG